VRFYPSLADSIFAAGFGSPALDTRTFTAKRASWETIELQPWQGTQFSPQPYALPATLGLECLIKGIQGDNQAALALQTSFTYDAVAGVYSGVINLGTVDMTQAFIIGCVGRNAQTGTAYPIVLGDLNKLVTSNNAASQGLTLPKTATQAFTVGQKVFLMSTGVGATTVIPEAGGASIVVATGAPVTVSAGPIYTLLPGIPCCATYGAGDVWTLSAPDELASITGFGEWAWWDASLASPHVTRSPSFAVTINNYIYSGLEGSPEALSDASGYYKKAEVDAAIAAVGSNTAPQAMAVIGGYIQLVLPAINGTYTLTADSSINLPSGTPKQGMAGFFQLTQDGTGNHDLHFSGAWKVLFDGPTINPTPGSVTFYEWIYSGTHYWVWRSTDDVHSIVTRLENMDPTVDGPVMRQAMGLPEGYSAVAEPTLQWGTGGFALANFKFTLTGNRTLPISTFNPPSQGARGCIVATQDATGGRTLSFAAGWVPLWSGSNINLTPSSVTVYEWLYLGTSYLIWRSTDDLASLLSRFTGLTSGQKTALLTAIGAQPSAPSTSAVLSAPGSLIASSVADNDGLSLTILANTLAVGSIIDLQLAGLSNNGVVAANFKNYVKVGAVKGTPIAWAMGTVAHTNVPWIMRGKLYVAAIGTAGTSLLRLVQEGLWTGNPATPQISLVSTFSPDTTANLTITLGCNVDLSAAAVSSQPTNGFIKLAA
jgi:hypothetical protein